jgi:hypothetical protein
VREIKKTANILLNPYGLEFSKLNGPIKKKIYFCTMCSAMQKRRRTVVGEIVASQLQLIASNDQIKRDSRLEWNGVRKLYDSQCAAVTYNNIQKQD